MRGLARRSHISAHEISASIRTVMTHIDDVVGRMRDVVALAADSVHGTRETSTILTQIREQTADLSAQVSLVAVNTQQQSQAVAEIAAHVELVHQGSARNSQVAAQTAGIARHLAQLSGSLKPLGGLS
ncbi:MAG: methyl-accepting chemotaxis protein [Gammaproteobacteria bacterium]|nr:methyl-accepting chemotaxis protein [Gammaproteobacteria bacterium]